MLFVYFVILFWLWMMFGLFTAIRVHESNEKIRGETLIVIMSITWPLVVARMLIEICGKKKGR